MKKRRQSSRGKNLTYVLLALAVVLLLGSAVGSTRAALNYYSENYTAQIRVSQIGVSLVENGEVVSSRDYDKDHWVTSTNNGDGDSAEAYGVLLQNMLKKDEKLALNKEYEEKLSVRNSGTIDEYVRVRIYKYWMRDGKKLPELSPKLIDLKLVNEGRWVKGPNDTGEGECTELYYKGILPGGEETALFADGIRIDGQVSLAAKKDIVGNIITTTYKYDGAEFHVDVEVDAVQTHNAQDAIKSAWGIDEEDVKTLGILEEE